VVASPKDLLLRSDGVARDASRRSFLSGLDDRVGAEWRGDRCRLDRKSTRLNSSHDQISYAGFCLNKKRSARWIRHCSVTRNHVSPRSIRQTNVHFFSFFFYHDTPTTKISTLSLHDALPI